MERTCQRIWDSIILSSQEVDLYKFDEEANDEFLNKKP